VISTCLGAPVVPDVCRMAAVVVPPAFAVSVPQPGFKTGTTAQAQPARSAAAAA
jgi:hypothetical protein